MNKIYSVFCLLIFSLQTSAQSDTTIYEKAYLELQQMLQTNDNDFKKGVYLVENAYLNNSLDKNEFNQQIQVLVALAKRLDEVNQLNYHDRDAASIKKNAAIYQLMTDTISVNLRGLTFNHIPFSYDFTDVFGEKKWEQMFVSKLLRTNKGNCHSLAYLYKTLSQELGVKAHLALIPYHIYIKQRSQKIGWYNTELTSKSHPTDGWIMTIGYVHIDAIRNGIYMHDLSDQESIALCVLDLAKGFERKFGGQHKDFIIKCCDLSLQYFPKNINAMLLKAETLKQQYTNELVKRHLTNFEDLKSDEKYSAIWEEMRLLYLKIHQLGYRQMPKKVYEQWLRGIEEK